MVTDQGIYTRPAVVSTCDISRVDHLGLAHLIDRRRVNNQSGATTAYLHSGSNQSLVAMDLTGCTKLWSVDTKGDLFSYSSPALLDTPRVRRWPP